MIDLYENDSKVYAENYSKIREFINRSDIQKGNDIDISYIIYRGYQVVRDSKNIFLLLDLLVLIILLIMFIFL